MDANETPTMVAINRIRNAWNYGQTDQEIIETLTRDGYTKEEIYLAFHGAKTLNKLENQ